MFLRLLALISLNLVLSQDLFAHPSCDRANQKSSAKLRKIFCSSTQCIFDQQTSTCFDKIKGTNNNPNPVVYCSQQRRSWQCEKSRCSWIDNRCKVKFNGDCRSIGRSQGLCNSYKSCQFDELSYQCAPKCRGVLKQGRCMSILQAKNVTGNGGFENKTTTLCIGKKNRGACNKYSGSCYWKKGSGRLKTVNPFADKNGKCRNK